MHWRWPSGYTAPLRPGSLHASVMTGTRGDRDEGRGADATIANVAADLSGKR
jgi:hypothetical protein